VEVLGQGWQLAFPRLIQSPGRAALRAGLLIEQAELTLEEASGVIANGYLRLDPQEWIRAVEKRRATLEDAFDMLGVGTTLGGEYPADRD
jgi:hypothetical protein